MATGEPAGTPSIKQDYFCILDESLTFDEAMMFNGELQSSLDLGNMPLDSLWLNVKTMEVLRVVQIANAPTGSRGRNGATEPPQALELLTADERHALRQGNVRFRCRYTKWENGNGRVLARAPEEPDDE